MPRNNVDVKDNPYKTPILTYNMEMDHLVEVNIISNKVEEEDCETCPNGEMMESDDEKKTLCPRHHT